MAYLKLLYMMRVLMILVMMVQVGEVSLAATGILAGL